MPGPDGEKGLGATLIGGAGGGFLGHEMGGGILGSLAGAVVGAIGMLHLLSKRSERNADFPSRS